MNFLRRLLVLFYVTLIMYIGCVLVLMALQLLPVEEVVASFHWLFIVDHARFVVGVSAICLLLINFIFYQLFTINVRKEKNIAFDNPAGRVSVSLVALEDLLRRKITQMDDVKDSKITIQASRKGLLAKVRLTFCSEVSIPELTAKVQSLVKQKVQDVIGLEEKVEIMVFVNKIIPVKTKEKPVVKKEEDEESLDANVPFQGYRA